ncbi:hypothetical protein DCAR_0209065 [Daucus carota subsp. sativus]|uniref:Auxin-repressed protein n=1 Tax=Daucus carota subsp. sativus TaxID=79200 RepID=A0A166F030_DAUCS|nr:PREDICTED: dormancy-associated protein 1-like [Daucus carota subsp. sativus]WOG89826.1 hypothetical protein DCAR_0209065 [Daucus carota subsp. sativus]
MGLMDKLWDDVMAGPQPERGLGRFRKIKTKTNGEGEGSSSLQRSLSTPTSPEAPATPTTPTTPMSPGLGPVHRDNVWRMTEPRSNPATRGIGSQVYDKPEPNSPTVYDWLYSGETKSKHR